MRHWLDPLIIFHQGNVPNTVACSPWVGNLSCVSFVTVFVSRPSLWESGRIGCFVACFFCLNNLGRNKSRFYPFGRKQFQERKIRRSTAVNKLPAHLQLAPNTKRIMGHVEKANYMKEGWFVSGLSEHFFPSPCVKFVPSFSW